MNKHTKGKVTREVIFGEKHHSRIEVNNIPVVDIRIHGENIPESVAQANSELVAETFSVSTKTGLTPRKLLEQRDKLLSQLEGVIQDIEHYKEVGAGPSSTAINSSKDLIKEIRENADEILADFEKRQKQAEFAVQQLEKAVDNGDQFGIVSAYDILNAPGFSWDGLSLELKNWNRLVEKSKEITHG